MTRVVRWYGANPLHLLALLASFALTGYAVLRYSDVPFKYAYWFIGSAVVHDLVLFPLYAIADASLVRALRGRGALDNAAVPWLNHWRVPAAISGLLALVWLPEISRVADPRYRGITTLTTDVFIYRWLAVTGVLFALSAVAYAVRLRRHRARPR